MPQASSSVPSTGPDINWWYDRMYKLWRVSYVWPNGTRYDENILPDYWDPNFPSTQFMYTHKEKVLSQYAQLHQSSPQGTEGNVRALPQTLPLIEGCGG